MWLDSKGSGRVREVSGRTSLLSARQRAAWVAAGSPRLPRAGRVNEKRFGQAGSRCPLLLAPPAVRHRTASAEEVDRSAQGSREGGPDRCGNHLDWAAPLQVRLRPDLRRGRLPPRKELRAPGATRGALPGRLRTARRAAARHGHRSPRPQGDRSRVYRRHAWRAPGADLRPQDLDLAAGRTQCRDLVEAVGDCGPCGHRGRLYGSSGLAGC